VSELRVPTVTLEAEILCADGRSFAGRIFLPAAASRRLGLLPTDEWMNDARPFFPFLPAEASTAVLLNKSEVVVLTVAEAGGEDEEAAGAPLVRRVQVECRERVVEGTVVIDMPSNQRRMQDYLNRPEPFLIVHDGDRRHLVRKTRITRVVEPGRE